MQTQKLSQLESDTDFSITHDFWGKTAGVALQGEELSSGNPALLPGCCQPDKIMGHWEGGVAQRQKPKVTDNRQLCIWGDPLGTWEPRERGWGRGAQENKK